VDGQRRGARMIGLKCAEERPLLPRVGGVSSVRCLGPDYPLVD